MAAVAGVTLIALADEKNTTSVKDRVFKEVPVRMEEIRTKEKLLALERERKEKQTIEKVIATLGDFVQWYDLTGRIAEALYRSPYFRAPYLPGIACQ